MNKNETFSKDGRNWDGTSPPKSPDWRGSSTKVMRAGALDVQSAEEDWSSQNAVSGKTDADEDSFHRPRQPDLHELLKTKCTVELVAQIGEVDQELEAVILNCVVRYVPRGADGRMAMELGPDQRHVEVPLTEPEPTDGKIKAATKRVK